MLSLFSGIGAFEKSLENIGIKINLINFCEIDKYATQAYCAIHGVDKKLILCIISCQDSDKITVKKLLSIFPYVIINLFTFSSAAICYSSYCESIFSSCFRYA